MVVRFLFRVFMVIIIFAVGVSIHGCLSSVKTGVVPEGEVFPCDTPITTNSGLIRGAVDKEGKTCSWKGVPYAAPPAGDLRWRSPQPPKPWSGVRDATHWGDICPQSGWKIFLNKKLTEMSEDCLNLNIWRPLKRGNFPVMVWIHGGGYTYGTGATPLYYGDRLSANGDVVVVTINYRLNVFGFLSHEKFAEEEPHGSTGNYGTMDQIAALRWVHDNIASFGGDLDNVTIFGESAGGWSVCTLLATPLARGLFHRAIMQSGGCEAVWSGERGYKDGQWSAETLGCEADDVGCMRNKTIEDVLDWLDPFPLSPITGKGLRYINHEDGCVLTGTPLSTIESGEFNNVPVLAGSNRDEVRPIIALRPRKIFMTRASYKSRVKEQFKDDAETVLRLYPADNYQSPALAYMAIMTDRVLGCPTYQGIRAAAGHQASTYYYRFDFDEMRFGRLLGSMHGMEIPFVFQNFDRAPINLLYGFTNEKKALELSRLVQQYWVNFAYTGNPNGRGLPVWPEFRPDDPRVQVIDTNTRTEKSDNIDRCAFWAEYNLTHPSILEVSEPEGKPINVYEVPVFPMY